MQKFKAKLKNVPRNAPQVSCSTSTVLNKDQSLSVQSKVLTLNNLEVDLRQHKDGQKVSVKTYVFVLSIEGKPLMPCLPRKARILLKKGEAKVVSTNPFFTIQLTKQTSNYVQKVSLGIDSGSKTIGFSAISVKSELIGGELELDCKISERIIARTMYRKQRRFRLWYRKPKFNNRKIEKGWLPPSIQRKFDTHIMLINKLKNALPIKEENVIVEVGNFDIQKLENLEILGNEYQQGPLYQYQNTRSFLMAREKGRCQFCEKDFKGQSSHIHHIIPKSVGGTDREKNLALLHKKCHKKLHEENLLHLLKKNRMYKDATFMNIIKNKFTTMFPECMITYGYETFVKRNELKLEKSHNNDAFVIADGTTQIKSKLIHLKQKRKNNRILQTNRKGFIRSVRKVRYSIRPYDIVFINKRKFIVKKCFCYGKQIMCFNDFAFKNFNVKKIEKIFHTKGIFA